MKQKNRILVLDPLGVCAFQIEAALGTQGFEVESCTQPKHLLQRLLQQAYQLLLCPLEGQAPTFLEETLQLLQPGERPADIPPMLFLLSPPFPSHQLFQTLAAVYRLDVLPAQVEASLLALKCSLMIRSEPLTVTHSSLPEGLSPAIRRLTSLSKREEEILNLVGQGLSNKEISRALILSEHSVRTHLYHIYAKLGIKRRSQAVLVEMYRQHGT